MIQLNSLQSRQVIFSGQKSADNSGKKSFHISYSEEQELSDTRKPCSETVCWTTLDQKSCHAVKNWNRLASRIDSLFSMLTAEINKNRL